MGYSFLYKNELADMNNKLSVVTLLVALCALVLSFETSQSVKQQGSPDPKETAYERVMRTQTLRCAYFMWRPFIYKDVTTGHISGFVPDILDKISQDLNLKIDYTEEVNIAQMFEGFATGRYDAVCGPVTPTISRTAVADFITPVGYAFINIYARADDNRFDGKQELIDNENVKIAAIEGEVSGSVAPLKFPKAKLISLPNIMDNASLLMELSTGKADIVLADAASANVFLASNPRTIKEVGGGPAVLLSGTIAIPPNEYALKAMLDSSVNYLVTTGYIAAMARKHQLSSQIYLPAIPHEKAE